VVYGRRVSGLGLFHNLFGPTARRASELLAKCFFGLECQRYLHIVSIADDGVIKIYYPRAKA